jgi:uncharacterized protein
MKQKATETVIAVLKIFCLYLFGYFLLGVVENLSFLKVLSLPLKITLVVVSAQISIKAWSYYKGKSRLFLDSSVMHKTVLYVFDGVKDFGTGVFIVLFVVWITFLIEKNIGWIQVHNINFGVGFWETISLMKPDAIKFISTAWWEELLFRYYPLSLLSRVVESAAGTLMSSVLFGLSHHFFSPFISWVEVPSVVFIGFLFALAYQRTRNIGLPFGLHFGLDFFPGTVFGYTNDPKSLSLITQSKNLTFAFEKVIAPYILMTLIFGSLLVILYTRKRLENWRFGNA